MNYTWQCRWSEWPLVPTDDLVRFWRSKVKGQGYILVQVRGGEGIHRGDDPRRRWGIEDFEAHLDLAQAKLLQQTIRGPKRQPNPFLLLWC